MKAEWTNAGSIKTGQEFCLYVGKIRGIFKRVGYVLHQVKERGDLYRIVKLRDALTDEVVSCHQNSIVVQERCSGMFYSLDCDVDVVALIPEDDD